VADGVFVGGKGVGEMFGAGEQELVKTMSKLNKT
jgi:hypothetical protein